MPTVYSRCLLSRFQGLLPKSRSDENLAQKPYAQRGHRKPHSRGYTSDSTLGHSTHFGRKKRNTGRVLSKATPRSLHTAGQQSRWGKTGYHPSKSPTQLTTLYSPVETPSIAQVTSRSPLEQKNKRPVDRVSDAGGPPSKRLPFLRRDRPKQVCIAREAQPTGAMTVHKEAPEGTTIGRREIPERRYSLQMKDVKMAKEKEVVMQSCRNDVRQQLVTVNGECMHRSHSFSSSASLNTGAESAENARKWIVYGFV